MPRYKKKPLKNSQRETNSLEKESSVSKDFYNKCKEYLKDNDDGNAVNQRASVKKSARDDDNESFLTKWISSISSNSPKLQNLHSTESEYEKLEHPPKKEPAPKLVPPKKEEAALEIGTIDLRLHIPGLLDILIPVPAPASVNQTQYINKIFDQCKDKYWCKSKSNGHFRCLICKESFKKLHSIQSHLAKHMGFPIARCTKCSKTFYHLITAQKHLNRCVD